MREIGARLVRALPLAGLLVLVAGLGWRPMAESDLFFRLAAGEEILRRHGLPGRNLFSFTYPDFPDIDTSWLFEVGAALLYRGAGFAAVVAAKTAVLLAVFAAAFALCRRRGAGPVASALALAAAAFVGRERFVERPHVFSLAGEIATLAAIDAMASEAPDHRRRRARAAVGFLIGVVVWANLHAGVFVAPLMLGAAAATAALRRHRQARALLLLALGAGLAALVTPQGWHLYRYLVLHLRITAVHAIDEFRSPSWTSDAPWMVYAAVFSVLAVLAFARGPGGDRGDAARALALAPIAPLALLALHAVRFAADFALVAAPFVAVTAGGLADRAIAAARRQRSVSWPRALPAIATAALLVGFTCASRAAAGLHLRDIGLDARELPLDAIAFVNANDLRDRMYNDFEIGSYLLFEPPGGYPRHRVFVDPRLPAYPLELHRLLGRADMPRGEWTAAMDRYGVETALLTYAGVNRRVAWWDPEVWALVFGAGEARVFVRRLPRYRALIAAREIPATFSFSEDEGTATLPLERRPPVSPVADCEWNRRLGDVMVEVDGVLSARARAAYVRALAAADCLDAAADARLSAWLGADDLAAGRPADALPRIERALGRGDREASTLTNRALALELLGRRRDAAAAWGDVVGSAPGSALARQAERRAAALH